MANIDSSSISDMVDETNKYRIFNPLIANMIFYYKTRNGGDARLKWIGENEFVLLKGSKLGKSITLNPAGEKADKNRKQYADKISNYVLTDDIVFDSLNSTSQIVIGGAANAWKAWKNDKTETIDDVIKKLNMVMAVS